MDSMQTTQSVQFSTVLNVSQYRATVCNLIQCNYNTNTRTTKHNVSEYNTMRASVFPVGAAEDSLEQCCAIENNCNVVHCAM